MKIFLPWRYYWIYVALTCASATGAGAISHMFAGWPGAKHSWIIGFSLVLIYAITCAVVMFKQRESVRYSFYMGAYASVAMLSLLLACSLPIFYIIPISTVAGAALFTLFIIIILFHQYIAYRYFNEQWEVVGRVVLEKSVKNNKFRMDFFRKKFDTSGAPNITDFGPYMFSLFLKILLILFLLVGLNLRKLFPIFSGFAWAIASMIIVAAIVQIALMQVLRAQRLSALEKKLGFQLTTDDTF